MNSEVALYRSIEFVLGKGGPGLLLGLRSPARSLVSEQGTRASYLASCLGVGLLAFSSKREQARRHVRDDTMFASVAMFSIFPSLHDGTALSDISQISGLVLEEGRHSRHLTIDSNVIGVTRDRLAVTYQ
jgi:hypothetical protein